MGNMNLSEMAPMFAPILIIQLGLQIYSIVDLVKRKTVRFNNKFMWGAIIILGQMLGSIVYLALRGDE